MLPRNNYRDLCQKLTARPPQARLQTHLSIRDKRSKALQRNRDASANKTACPTVGFTATLLSYPQENNTNYMPELQEIQTPRAGRLKETFAQIDSSLGRSQILWTCALLVTGFLIRISHAS